MSAEASPHKSQDLKVEVYTTSMRGRRDVHLGRTHSTSILVGRHMSYVTKYSSTS